MNKNMLELISHTMRFLYEEDKFVTYKCIDNNPYYEIDIYSYKDWTKYSSCLLINKYFFREISFDDSQYVINPTLRDNILSLSSHILRVISVYTLSDCIIYIDRIKHGIIIVQPDKFAHYLIIDIRIFYSMFKGVTSSRVLVRIK